MKTESDSAAGLALVASAAMLCFVATAGVGCSPDRLATVPAKGTVRVDGKPAAGVQVVLHPVGADDARLAKLRPTARTGSDGGFAIGTYELADGAPAGDYKITAEWFSGGPATSSSGSEDPEAVANATEFDRLGGRFADPESSALKASVGDVPSTIPPLDLTTRGAKPSG